MANRRKSAFSVYAETKVRFKFLSFTFKSTINFIYLKPEEPQLKVKPHLESNSKKVNQSNSKKNQNNHIVPNKEQKTKQLQPKKNLQNNGVNLLKPLNGGVSKRKVELNNKKENNKFAKLPIEEISESIKIFNGKTNGNNGNLKKKAFTPKDLPSHVVFTEKEFRKFVQETKDNSKLTSKPIKVNFFKIVKLNI